MLLSLYHTKNYQGTTTCLSRPCSVCPLYHTKNYQGTTTTHQGLRLAVQIIPYQELPGNYNAPAIFNRFALIIPYQELPGNYNLLTSTALWGVDYTIPRTTRELQPRCASAYSAGHYTIPRTTRELQLRDDDMYHIVLLYHTKNYQGTTTHSPEKRKWSRLYHTKNYQGTTTDGR